MPRRTHEQLKKIALSKSGVKKQYDALEEEFQLLEEMLSARQKSGKTQRDVAKAMKTTTSVVGRLETAGGKLRHSPTIETLRKYAHAVNCHLEIKFIRSNQSQDNIFHSSHKKEKIERHGERS